MELNEAVKAVIALAEAVRDYWNTELPKRLPDYPIVRPTDPPVPPPPEQQKLLELLASLPDDTVFKLALIMHLGRGRGTRNLARQYEAVKERYGGAKFAAALMAERASLADDLVEGMAELRRNHIDLEAALAAPAGSRP